MTDPLDALRLPVTPAQPDPAFARRLRERLERVLLGGTLITEVAPEDFAWGPSLQPYLGVADARRALDWYVDVFGARRHGEPAVMPDGSIGHAELLIGDSILMLAEWGNVGAGSGSAGVGHTIFVSVPDVDLTVSRASAAGARIEEAPQQQRYGRTGVIVDPFGYRWMVNTRPPSATQARPGDVVSLTVFARDEESLRSFYGAVLGPRPLAGETTPTVSVTTGDPGTVPAYRVPDVAAAVERIRESGGQAGQPERRPYGTIATATDPEGNRFEVWQPPRG
jgi:uncharacterized glyoxalase superfamily protein PhnB